MTAAAPSPSQQRPSSPSHDLDIDEQDSLLPSDYEQDLHNAAQPVGFDPPFRVSARIRWINFVLGAAVLLPWNAIITAMPYFLSRLSGSVFQATFSSYLSTTFTVSNFCFLAHATVTSKQSNYSQQIRRSLLALTALASILAISTFTPLPPALFFILILLNGACQASAGAYLQSAVVALASLFGPEAMQPVMSGQAAVGVLVSLIQVLSAGTGIRTSHGLGRSDGEDSSAARAAFVFFGLSTLFLVFTIALHAWLVTMPSYKAVVIPFEAKKGVLGADEEREALVRRGRVVDRLPHKKGRITDVAKMNAEYNFAAAYVFMITLSVFPPITSSIRSVHPPSSSTLSHPLIFTAIHFLTFNIGDLIGRYLPMVSRLQIWSSRSHLYMALARTLFVPLFLLCNVRRPSSLTVPVTGVPVINSDIVFFLILLFFGMTNGYIGSLVMMAAPSQEHNPRLKYRPEDVDTAATIAQFCLVGGLAIGSFMSFGVRGAICACNPFTT